MPAGRPTVRDEDINRKIEEAASLGATVEEIAFYIGVYRTTLYRWMQDDSELKDRIQELQQRPILQARQTIIKAISNSPAEAKWYLEKKLKGEFGNSIDITTGGNAFNAPTKQDEALAKQLLELENHGTENIGGTGADPLPLD